MLILKFFRLFFGYVSFTAQGGFPERFINLCRRHKILIWELKSNGSVISACTDCAGYRKIRPIARKSGMCVRISKKHGLPFFINRHSRRIGVLVGACVFGAVLIILSTRLWSVDVTGNVRVPAEEIIGVFEQLGVKRGAAGSKIDIGTVEIAALQKLPELSWLNINISGSAAHIEVRERIESPLIDSDNQPADIIAARDGQIVILRPFNGTQEQKIGNAVLKGDLLISGIEENKDLTVSFCKASGYVVARTNRSVAVSQSEKISAKVQKSVKKGYIIDFLFFSVPIGKTEGEGIYREKSEVFINGVTLPIGLTRCCEILSEEQNIALTQGRAELLAYLRFFDKCTEDFKYLKIENSEISKSEQSGESTVSGKFVCLENIGEERAMQIEQGENRQTES